MIALNERGYELLTPFHVNLKELEHVQSIAA